MLFNFNLKSHMWLVASLLDIAALEATLRNIDLRVCFTYSFYKH